MFNKPQTQQPDPKLPSPQTTHTLPAPLLYTCQTIQSLPSLLHIRGAGLCAKPYTFIVSVNFYNNHGCRYYYYCLTTSKFHEGQDFCLLCSLLFPRFLEHEFAHRTCSVNMLNEWIPILWMRKLRLRETRPFAQGHTVTVWWNQDSNHSLTDTNAHGL